MRILASIAAVLLFLFLLTSVPAFSQEGNDRPDHPQDESHPEARPQEQTRPEERRDEHANRPQEQSRPEGQVRQENRGEQGQRVAGEQGRGQHRGQRIPDDRFRSSFGREHHFHVERARIINQAQPEFVYSGYTFELADPWPAEWSYDDDCYIDYVDGDYYLYDAYHPGIRILVFVIG